MARLSIIKNSNFDNTLAIACLIRYCSFDPLQAEQCAMIIDKKGRYTIKEGETIELAEIAMMLDSVGFNTQVIDY